MRLTLESTVFENKTTVMIEIDNDCLNISEVIDRMVAPVLAGFGFHPDNIKEFIKLDDDVESMEE